MNASRLLSGDQLKALTSFAGRTSRWRLLPFGCTSQISKTLEPSFVKRSLSSAIQCPLGDSEGLLQMVSRAPRGSFTRTCRFGLPTLFTAISRYVSIPGHVRHLCLTTFRMYSSDLPFADQLN